MSNLQESNSYTGLEIAVIGMSGRFPGADNTEEFWENIREGKEGISFFSEEELLEAGVDTDTIKNPRYVNARGIIDNVEKFDAQFFDYKPEEVRMMDPQTRLFHECVWEALESAAYNPYNYEGSIGLFAGATNNQYWEAVSLLATEERDAATSFNSQRFVDKDFLATMISYKLNLRGPSMVIQTACSTSLVAVDVASQQLLLGKCDMALAGAVSITFPQKNGYIYQDGMLMSPDGHCRAFDADAQGVAMGAGAGVVLLKRLEDAFEDGDNILAVIKGSGINNDGSRKIGYTAPSVEGQSQVIKKVHYMGDIDPETITCIEAHGTGTSLGDPVEIEALKQAFHSEKRNFCALGSVKTNIGHLDVAAGVASLIKTVLALKHKQLPPSLHYKKANPGIDFENSPFYVNHELRAWKNLPGQPLRGGVSSFGIGGTNAHVVLEEAPAREASAEGRPWQMLLLSAKTSTALDQMTENLTDYLKKNPRTNLADLAYSLQTGRSQFKYRRMVLAENVQDAVTKLEKSPVQFKVKSEIKNTVFMFPGQGTIYTEMGLELYNREPDFREEIDNCLSKLKPLLPFDLKSILYPGENSVGDYKITDSIVTQPATFIFEYALAKLMMKWGIMPDSMIGHSIGEYVAACVAGVFSLDDALKLVVLRGHLMHRLPKGSMLGVPLTEEKLKPYLNDKIALAAVNSTSACVVAGEEEAVNQLEEQLLKMNCHTMKLPISHASHSKMMLPMVPELMDLFNQITLSKPQIPYISNFTGKWISVEEATDPEYWSCQLLNTVRFADGVTEILKNENTLFIEVGAGRTLNSFVKRHKDYSGETVLNLVKYNQEGGTGNQSFQRSLINLINNSPEQYSDQPYLFQQLARLWCHGHDINWKQFYKQEKRQRLPLPTYPFERQPYWIEGDIKSLLAAQNTTGGRKALDEWFYTPSWKKANPLELHSPVDSHSTLVFASASETCHSVMAYLKESGQRVIKVLRGGEFQKNSESYVVNPREASHFEKLFADLKESAPENILYFWSFDSDAADELDSKIIKEFLDCDFYSLISIAQAIGKVNITDDISLKVVTHSIHDVTGNESLSPEKSLILGPVKTIPQEFSNIHCMNIDLEHPVVSEGAMAGKDFLLSDLTGPVTENIAVYRGKNRWVQCFESISLTAKQEQPPRLKTKGVYLITGGLGGIGFAIAQYLAETFQAKLILTGRTSLPPQNEWDSWLETHGDTDTVSRKIVRVRELETLGAEVLVVSSDIADKSRMEAVCKEAKDKLGRINGVIHSAGVPDGGIIQLRNKENTEPVLAPKVYGTLVLDELLAECDLDFFILCSSLNSILNTIGQVGYCSANNFIDAYTIFKNRYTNRFTMAINWFAWGETGMAYDNRKGDLVNLKDAILTSEGVEVFRRVLHIPRAGSVNQVIVSPLKLENLIESTGKLGVSKMDQPFSKSDKEYSRPDIDTHYVEPESEMEKKLFAIWHDILGFSQIGVDDNFFDLGANSLDIIRARQKILDQLHCDIPLVSMYQYTTIRLLTQYILLGENLENQLDEEDSGESEKDFKKGKNRLRQRRNRLEEA